MNRLLASTSFLLHIFIILLLSSQVLTFICHTMCTYIYNPPGYDQGCNWDGINDCSTCDSTYFFYNIDQVNQVNQCNLRKDGIYNSTMVVDNADWLGGDALADTVSGSDYVKLRTNKITTVNVNLGIKGVYAVRVRVTFIDSTNVATCRLFLSVNSYAQCVPRREISQSTYDLNQWIYTSPNFMRDSTSMTLTVNIQRNEVGPTAYPVGGGTDFGFSNVVIMMAQCVQFCENCTSLQLCLECDASHYLEYYNKQCETACPDGQYEIGSTKICDICDPKCLQCSILSTNCTICKQSGVNEAFYHDEECHLACPDGHIENYTTHVCECPAEGYIALLGICYPCHIFCTTCFGTLETECNSCALGYYLVNGSNTCVDDCPIGQYEMIIEELSLCYICDPNCYECDGNATKCTSCSFPSPSVVTYLNNITNDQCVELCPDGYEGNNSTFVCDQCELGAYSFENKCYSDCPSYYVGDDRTRACTLSGGYPLELNIQVLQNSQLEFQIEFPLSLRADSLTELKDNWKTFISLYFRNDGEPATIKRRRLNENRILQSSSDLIGRELTISSVTVTSSKLLMYTNSVTQLDIVSNADFEVIFDDNLYSSKNVMYEARCSQSLDNIPWIVSKFFSETLAPVMYLGISFVVFAVIGSCVGMAVSFRGHLKVITMEFLHMIQIVGLTVFAIYPKSFDLLNYSFLYGMNFANLDFIYNIPKEFVAACYQNCVFMTSYAFVQGDMDWLRSMGSILETSAVVIIIGVCIYIPECSRRFSVLFMRTAVEFIVLKSIHSWFASLIFVILNYSGSTDTSYFGTHVAGYLFLGPVLAFYVRSTFKNGDSEEAANGHLKYYRVSLIFKILIVLMLVILPLAPVLICALIVILTMVEWVILVGYDYVPEYSYEIYERVADKKYPQYHRQSLDSIDLQKFNIKKESSKIKIKASDRIYFPNENSQMDFFTRHKKSLSNQMIFHKYLLFSLRPMTALAISAVILLESSILCIGLISGFFVLMAILICIDGCLLHFTKKVANQYQDQIPPKKIEATQESLDIKDLQPSKEFKAVFKDEDVDEVQDAFQKKSMMNKNRYKKTFRVADIS